MKKQINVLKILNLFLFNKILLGAFFVWSIPTIGWAQYTGGGALRTIRLPSHTRVGDTLARDTFSIVPNTIQILDIHQKNIDNLLIFNYLEIKNNLILVKKNLDSNCQFLKYRVYPFDFEARLFRLDSATVFRRDAFSGDIPIDYDYSTNTGGGGGRDNLFETNALRYGGSFARGVSVGNAQNLVLNSQFNLNLTGKISQDVDITAAISDQNIPLQAEGNTQQLREFDQIALQLRRRNDALTAGDFVQNSLNGSYFLRYYKKMQGLKLEHTDTTARIRHFGGGAAVARGKFRRQSVPTQEGNQGPYRLVGESGEVFLIVLSGTERVWLDGNLMRRGDNLDYVIDYNAATLTFTPRHLINTNSRVVVEFEYADQNYLRLSYFGQNELKINKLQIKINFYGEQDSKNSSGVQQLDSLEKLTLARGDDWVPSVRRDSFSVTRVMYAQADTTVGGRTYSVFRYTTRPDLAQFVAQFSPVGAGRGNYVQDLTAVANGRVYRWVAPDAQGQPQGDFEPVRRLIPPVLNQILTTNFDYQISKNLKFEAEWAGSRFNRNLFSSQNGAEQFSFSNFHQISYQNFLNPEKKTWKLGLSARNEFTRQGFQTFAPFRNQEFTRDWNLQTTPQNVIGTTNAGNESDENYFNSKILLSKNDSLSIGYDFSDFRTTRFRGSRHTPRLQVRHRWANVFFENQLVSTRDTGGGHLRLFLPDQKLIFQKIFISKQILSLFQGKKIKIR